MLYAILADIHGNLEALTTAIDFIEKNFVISKYFILGDILGYGANPNECCEIIKKLSAVYIFGNHEYAILDKLNLEHFNLIARQSDILTKKMLSKENINFIKKFSLTYKDKNNFTLIHGSLTNPVEDYIFYREDAKNCFPGSIGQPRDNNNKLSFAIFDRTKNQINFYRLAYNINTTAKKILAANFPEKLATRLFLGV